jgi:hypothetical protein
MFELVLINKEDGLEYDPGMVFVNEYSDGGTCSIATTLSNLLKEYEISIRPKMVNLYVG